MTTNAEVQAADLMMRSAGELLRARGIDTPSVQLLDEVIVEMKVAIPAALDEALNDARIATECGMHQVASATFALTFKLAGLRAAERALARVAS